LKTIVVYLIFATLFFNAANRALAANCPFDRSSVQGVVNLTANPEEFYKILQTDISMGVILSGLDQTMQSNGYRFTLQYSKVVVEPAPQGNGSHYKNTFTLTRSALKLNPHTPLGHNIHMPNLIVTGEVNVESNDRVNACISNIEIENTTFGRL